MTVSLGVPLSGVGYRARQRPLSKQPISCPLPLRTLFGSYTTLISSLTRTVPVSITLAQIPPRPFRACVMPGSVRRSMYRQTERGPRYSNATFPTRNRWPRPKVLRLIPLVTTLRRCSPLFTLTPVSRSISSRSSAAIKVTWQTLPKRLQGTVAITLQTATFECGGRLDTLHLCTTFRSKEYTLHEFRHHQASFESCSAIRQVLQYPD